MNHLTTAIRTRLIGILLAGLFLTTILVVAFVQRNAVAEETSPGDKRLLRHVVMFKFNDSSSEADIQAVVDGFGMLPKKISAIHDYEFGTDNSPEGLADGFTHCFLVTFKSEEDRAAYLPHPDHKAFVEILKPHLDKVLVVDYWTK